MKERPILFSAPMVRAILEGRKTVTRRVVKPQTIRASLLHEQRPHWIDASNGHVVRCPYGQPGDRLWVRETWCSYGNGPIYRADYDKYSPISDGIGGPWKPSVHMPRWASRIALGIVSVRVERLQNLDDHDAMAEGADQIGDCEGAFVAGFRRLWESINGPGSWDQNPWVWVIEFKRVEQGPQA